VRELRPPKPEQITAICDTREQLPLDLPIKCIRGTLYTGDYSAVGMEDDIALERKSLQDFLGCVGSNRDRFERELIRLRGYPVSGVFIEGTWDDVDAGIWRSKLTPKQVFNTVWAWQTYYRVPFFFLGTRQRVARAIASTIFFASKYSCEKAFPVIKSYAAASGDDT
jgi:DNA excision repair protein ERCC-4